MGETVSSIDGSTLRQRRLTAAAVLWAVLLIGSIPIFLPMTCIAIGMVQTHAKRSWLLTDVDHSAVRDAGRLLLAKQEDGSSIDLLELPKELARLHPNHAYIDSRGSLKLEFGGGFYHYGLYVVPEDAEGMTLDIEPPLKFTPLATGIWFYEET